MANSISSSFRIRKRNTYFNVSYIYIGTKVLIKCGKNEPEDIYDNTVIVLKKHRISKHLYALGNPKIFNKHTDVLFFYQLD